ncbi:MAG: hypothetical protein IJN76_04075 [Clostridia bacterium]|nr:hypothetical protein [Clostridia bacterium]
MDKNERNAKDYYVIDLAHIVKVIWQRIWIVALVSLLTTAIGFSMAAFVIPPKYSSSIMLYVNNSVNVGDIGFSISSSELTAAQSLAKTYTVLLKNRTTLEEFLLNKNYINTKNLDPTIHLDPTLGDRYTWEDVYDMIDSGPVNETEVMQVTVTCGNAEDAKKIAEGISVVLPDRVDDVVEGATMKVVDKAVVQEKKVAPSVTTYTVLGFILGAMLSVLVLIIVALMDNTVHDEEYVIRAYDYPILAKVPSLNAPSGKKYSSYSYSSSRSSGKGATGR